MSVEEARLKVEQSVVATAAHGAGALALWLVNRQLDPSKTYGSLDMRIDRLILEVQAEMPCIEDNRRYIGVTPCPSCSARTRLAAVPA